VTPPDAATVAVLNQQIQEELENQGYTNVQVTSSYNGDGTFTISIVADGTSTTGSGTGFEDNLTNAVDTAVANACPDECTDIVVETGGNGSSANSGLFALTLVLLQ
jgi:hypothetical protein